LKSRHCHRPRLDLARTTFAGLFLLYMILALVPLANAEGARYDIQPTKATFIRYVTMPGASDFIQRPKVAHYDRFHNEFLIADSGHNRIVILSASGAYKFDFSLREAVSVPSDIVTDHEGYIYILGSSPSGRVLHRFDFDGQSLGDIPIPNMLDGIPVAPRSLAYSDDGRLFLLDEASATVMVLRADGELLNSFGLDVEGTAEFDLSVLERITLSGTEIFVPASSASTVLRFDLDGNYLGSMGAAGNKPGSLNRPVAVEVTPEGVVAVLDRRRFCVVCFDKSGVVLGEFGGKGINPGWFMGPSLLSVPSSDRILVGQHFRNTIQICAIPEFVRGRNQADVQFPGRSLETGILGPAGSDHPSTTSHTVNSTVSLSPESFDSKTTVSLSHLEDSP